MKAWLQARSRVKAEINRNMTDNYLWLLSLGSESWLQSGQKTTNNERYKAYDSTITLYNA